MSQDPFLRRITSSQSQILAGLLGEHEAMYGDDERARKRSQLGWAYDMSRAGPEVTSQELGKYLSRRLKAKQGRPSNQRKSPEQLRLLSEVFERNSAPNAHDIILLMHSTGLTKAQITAWFGVERERPENEGELVDTSEILEISPAAIWRAYDRDPIGYTNSLLEARRLGEEQDERDDEYEMEEYRHWNRLREIDPVRAQKEEDRRNELELLGMERERDFRAAATGQVQPPLYMSPSSPITPMEAARDARMEQEHYRSRRERGQEERARIRAGN